MDKFPSKDLKDHGYNSVKIGLSIVPVFGGVISGLFETIFTSPIDKRKEAWLTEIGDVVSSLCEKVEDLTPEKLAANDEFLTAFLQASNIAMRSHHARKIASLVAAVKNTVLMPDLEEVKRFLFIKSIDDFLPLHFHLLEFIHEPDSFLKEEDFFHEEKDGLIMDGTPVMGSLWDKCNPAVKVNEPVFRIALKDLFRLGFVKYDDIGQFPRVEKSTTDLGGEFLQFIDSNL